MKKKIITLVSLLILFSQSSFGFNSILRQEYTPTYQSVDKNRSNYQLPTTKLQPQSNDRIQDQLRDFRQDPNGSPRYNSSCQFGLCMPGGPGSSMYNDNGKR